MESEKLKARLVLTHADDKVALDCVNKLVSLGFEISSSSKRGVTFNGSASLFADVFNTFLNSDDQSDQPLFKTQPIIPDDFSNKAKHIYFPGHPELFEPTKKEN